MKLSRKSFLAVLSLAAGGLVFSSVISDAGAQAARAGYKWEVHKSANVKFEIPKAWDTSTDGDDVLITKAKDGGLTLEFIAISNGQKEARAAEKTIEVEILKRIPDAHVTEPAKPVTQNGLTGTLIKGEGHKRNSKEPIEFFAVFLGDGKGHGLLSVGFAGKGQIAKHRDQVVEIFNSIRPVK
ncbi:Hypothetical protein A7982_08526 [Minicystis rosea]|nr:Hypothetical protein A7982_08526 [Minicystis rosea]